MSSVQSAAARLFNADFCQQANALNCLSAELKKTGRMNGSDVLTTWEHANGPRIYAESAMGAEFSICIVTGEFSNC
jgi:hypothetical protein